MVQAVKKIFVFLIIFILLNNFIFVNMVMAVEEKEDIISPTTGLDTFTGYMLEPTVTFITFVLDAIMGVFSSIMTQQGFASVMLGKENIGEIKTQGEVTGIFTISDMTPYQSATGSLEGLKYPNFSYSPEDIFAGKIELFSIDFISGKVYDGSSETGELKENSNSDWQSIRKVISQWYQILRMLAIVGLLSVLIYTGIKIILSSSSNDKAKYKKMLINWLVAVILVFTMHYIMAFIISFVNEVSYLLGKVAGLIQVDAGGTKFKTNLIGLARFQVQKQLFSAKIGHLIIYTALVVYTFKFTFLYFKRAFKMAFLTMISPIVALTYPIDKMNDDKAQGFDMWLKEYIFNALLQPLHCILYYILVSSSLSLAANNPIYGVVALMFISNAEKLLKGIFGFNKARGGTVGGIAGAFATGAVTTFINNSIRNPFGISNGNNKLEKSNFSEMEDDSGVNYLEDTLEEDTLLGALDIDPNMVDIEKFLEKYRQTLPISVRDLGGLSWDKDENGSFEDILKMMAEFYRTKKNPGTIKGLSSIDYDELKNLLKSRVESNEMPFFDNDIQPQYIDGDTRSSGEILDEIMRLNELATDPFTASNIRRGYTRESERLMKKLKRRMAQNEYIQRNGGAVALKKQEEAKEEQVQNNSYTDRTNIDTEVKERSIARGIGRAGAKIGKTIIKPVWDADKGLDWKYNGKRLAGKVAKGVGGVTVGVAAAAVQAGVSITDGKYNPLEGVASVGAGIVGVSHLARNIKNKAELNSEDRQSLEKYSERWFNRDDIINQYDNEYHENGKNMRRRAVNNYVSRGITDFKEQKQAMKYADLLQTERGLSEEQADVIAISTLQYKKSLTGSNNYTILFDEKKRNDYINTKADSYSGSASKGSIKRLHEELIQNVRDFERVNK